MGFPQQQPSVSICGTRGVPPRYGGFETLAAELAPRLVDRGFPTRVYCRNRPDSERPTRWNGVECVDLSAPHVRGLETLSHTAASFAHLWRHPTDVVLLCNVANAVLLPMLAPRRTRAAVNVDGLEWARSKWGPAAQRWYRASETVGAKIAPTLIADNPGIAEHWRSRHGRDDIVTISYGATRPERNDSKLSELGLTHRGFDLVVSRIEPENHVDVIVDGWARSARSRPLVVVGDNSYGGSHRDTVKALAGTSGAMWLGSVWDQGLLDALYASARCYLHGHSVGGTNPSLVRAMAGASMPIVWDCVFNRSVIESSGATFSSAAELAHVLDATTDDVAAASGQNAASLAATNHDWDRITDQYAEVLVATARRRSR